MIDDDAFTQPEPRLKPGLYLTDPQGHALLVGTNEFYGDNRKLAVLDMGGVVSVGGIEIRDPEVLAQLAARLAWLADRWAGRGSGSAV